MICLFHGWCRGKAGFQEKPLLAVDFHGRGAYQPHGSRHGQQKKRERIALDARFHRRTNQFYADRQAVPVPRDPRLRCGISIKLHARIPQAHPRHLAQLFNQAGRGGHGFRFALAVVALRARLVAISLSKSIQRSLNSACKGCLLSTKHNFGAQVQIVAAVESEANVAAQQLVLGQGIFQRGQTRAQQRRVRRELKEVFFHRCRKRQWLVSHGALPTPRAQ